ncbi:MAG: methionyl-tRNA formyltransferase [Nitrospinae bacterium]|nr:methionyl-tRNA formyltransferase [Nitrospinota bacterium]
MKIIFMGTPDFALPAFQGLLDSRHEVIAAVTQPDRPKGRGRTIESSPIKREALRHDIPVFQPENVREENFKKNLTALRPDIIVVVAFGQIIPKGILGLPSFGCVNLHASLLPKYRGAAPMEWALIKGETRTGNTTMLMDEGLDSGDILLQEEIMIPSGADVTFLYERLSKSGARLVLETLEKLEAGKITPRPQNPEEVTYAPRLKKEDGLIRWENKNTDIVNMVRGLVLRPGACAFLNGNRIRVWKTEISGLDMPAVAPGQIVKIDRGGIHVSAKEGYVLLREIQMEGKKRMDAFQFVQGHKLEIGEKFTKS